ncbi:cytochrome c oxidase subunit 8A, mitochondrial-like [Glandiceps talaboti]
MSAIRGLFQRSLPAIRNQTSVVQRRTVMGGPPQQKVTVAENIIAFTVLFFGVMTVPGWVLAHLDNYRSRPDAEE